MRAMFWVGVTVLVLGIASVVVPIPRSEREGLKVGGLSVAVETRREQRVSPLLSAVVILAGLGAMAAGKMKAGRG